MRALLERYEIYRRVLEEAGLAIALRDEDRLAELEAESARLLMGIQQQWAAVQPARESAGDLPPGDCALLPILRDAMVQALSRIGANQAALAEWLQETGTSIRSLSRGGIATREYASGAGIKPAWFRINV
jgi:hypothetical protein